MIYEYLAGVTVLSLIWLICFLKRKDMRKPMIWSGLAYILFTIPFFILLIWIIPKFIYFGDPIYPEYWSSKTLFNLMQITNGLSIEDLAFMFFAGGVAAFAYEGLFRKKIKVKRSYTPHLRAVLIGYILALVIQYFLLINHIYVLIFSALIGAAFLCIDRKDLIRHALLGGITFAFLYFTFFLFFNFIFPDFVPLSYKLENISGILLWNVPLEEVLYAFSFGLLGGPLYEYAHGEKDIDVKSR